MTISTLPPAPLRSDATNADTYSATMEAFVAALPNFSSQVNTALTDINSASSGAIAAANFKGNWSSLTGALNIPATVLHSSTVWMLLENVADVTAEVPGVSVKWLNLSQASGTVALTGDQTIAGNKTFTSPVTAPSFVGDGSGLTNVEAVNSFGSGQVWQTVTRATATNYQNTTGKPLAISYQIYGAISGELMASLDVGASTGSMVKTYDNRVIVDAKTGFSHFCTITSIIPVDYYYAVYLGAGCTIAAARELR